MWKKARTLGRGSFGLVSLAISQPNDESKLNLPSLMAVKSAETFQYHSLQKESNLLTELNDCPNILRCYGSFISNDDDNNSVEPIRNFFAALFLANIGMLIHVHFLWNHIDILLAAVMLVIVIKTLVVATVVKGFRYNNKSSLLVGMSLAQIGEFAFVLLSRASNVHLVEGKLYLLLLGTTALSLDNFSSSIPMDGKTELQILSFQAPKIRLLRSLCVEGNETMQVLSSGTIHFIYLDTSFWIAVPYHVALAHLTLDIQTCQPIVKITSL